MVHLRVFVSLARKNLVLTQAFFGWSYYLLSFEEASVIINDSDINQQDVYVKHSHDIKQQDVYVKRSRLWQKSSEGI